MANQTMNSKKNSTNDTTITRKYVISPWPENKISKMLSHATTYKPKAKSKCQVKNFAVLCLLT